MIENYGIVHEEIRSTDHFLGSEDIAGELWEKVKMEKDGVLDWADATPSFEYQKKAIETNACVSFSGDNMFEYLAEDLRHKNNDFSKTMIALKMLDDNGKVNFSDRRTAKGSGTDPYRGNSVRAVDDYLRNFLFCPESMWGFSETMSLQEYYGVMPNEVANFNKKMEGIVEINTKYLPTASNIQYSTPEQIMEGLQYSPVWVSVKVPYIYNGEFISGDPEMMRMLGADQRPYGHRVLVRGGVRGQYFEVHDNYQSQIIKFAWNYLFGSCKIGRINFKQEDLEDVIMVEKDMYIRAKGGVYKDEYLKFGDGDVAKAISPNGEYIGLNPRTRLGSPPVNFKGNYLEIKKKFNLLNIFGL